MTAFVQNVHYCELRGGDPLSKGRYRFRLLTDVSVRVPSLAGCREIISCRDREGREWLRFDGDILTVRKDYAWNGCSVKRWLGFPFYRWVGTPDFEATRLPSGIHDALYQFIAVAQFPLSRSECDWLFYRLLLERDFWLADTYYGAVRDFGASFAPTEAMDGIHSTILTPSFA